MKNTNPQTITDFFKETGKEIIKSPKTMSTLAAYMLPIYGEILSYLSGKNEWGYENVIAPAIVRGSIYASALNFALFDSTTIEQRMGIVTTSIILNSVVDTVIYLGFHKKPMKKLLKEYSTIAKTGLASLAYDE